MGRFVRVCVRFGASVFECELYPVQDNSAHPEKPGRPEVV